MGLVNRLSGGEVRVSAGAIVNHGGGVNFHSPVLFSIGIYIFIGTPPFQLFVIQ